MCFLSWRDDSSLPSALEILDLEIETEQKTENQCRTYYLVYLCYDLSNMYVLKSLLLVLLSSIVASHGLGLGFLGSPELLRALAPRFVPQEAPPQNDYRDTFNTENVFPGSLVTARAEKMTCGVVNGSCPAGYWFVFTQISCH